MADVDSVLLGETNLLSPLKCRIQNAGCAQRAPCIDAATLFFQLWGSAPVHKRSLALASFAAGTSSASARNRHRPTIQISVRREAALQVPPFCQGTKSAWWKDNSRWSGHHSPLIEATLAALFRPHPFLPRTQYPAIELTLVRGQTQS
jgi:hypothetical protein